MRIKETKNSIELVPKKDIALLIAEAWRQAEPALIAIEDDSYREIPVSQYPLQILCLVIRELDRFNSLTSAKKEIEIERLKDVLEPVCHLLDEHVDLDLPTYSRVERLMPNDNVVSFFTVQLEKDFMRLTQSEADALAKTLCAVVYAYHQDFENGKIESILDYYVERPYNARNADEQIAQRKTEPSTSSMSPLNTPMSTTAANTSTYSNSNPYQKTKRLPGEWIPLKAYLIITTAFVALVFGLVFLSVATGVGSSSMSIMDVNGNMVAIKPNMKPAELFLFGKVNYNELLFWIKTAAITFIIWRIIAIVGVFKLVAHRRRKGVTP